ncbi:hypothetical protein FE257_003313 [Aspergillus nanangensis]|uniref:Gem-associated protein 5 TPR domain-containing protein n=1 Tax=Aspergillus nanangensis TaxID=2582783 RepID=A0AAD4CU47_ASPNN|nr:hypothetical protein FE257_003313 [Aspergillus nanangensis]
MVDLAWNVNPAADSRSSTLKPMAPPMPPQPRVPVSSFAPCASTASLFLYAQGTVISCLHHDTLALERRFENHQEEIRFICVDNVSERGAGRLVVSYDAGQTAIVWDLFTGSVIARFASFEQLRVASWMRNGNVAFGNEKGDVILFEPSTSEHVSCRTIFDPITALAPGTDCRTYALGYQNGSILIATLHPSFTVMHTMTTSRGPSPIVSLAWHASSSKQKSDMLATLSSNGDLRVWSVAKPPGKEAPRVIRVLKRSDASSSDEPKWMGWSKNGKIIQYLDGETCAWDVKTKHVTYEPIPTIEGTHGITNYGPTATLFTLGPQYTVQQYDMDNPAMVANVQHLPVGALPAPLDDARGRTMSPRSFKDPPEMRESGNVFGNRRTPFDANGIDAVRQQRADMTSPGSSRSHANSVSSNASSGKYRTVPFSPPSRSGQTGTSFSMTSASGRDTPQPPGMYAYTQSVSTSSAKSSRAGSRLRNEVQFSPADKPVDLFPFTRARLNDVPFRNHPPLNESNLTPDDLRRQMLSVVFGWEGDIDGLLNDELSRHPPASQGAILLAQWLGEFDTAQMASMIGSGAASMTDWMLLAFSQMSGESQANKVGQAFVQKLLKIGDVHTSATILLSLGDKNDAIEVYVSQSYYMEAILMTCLLMPTDWQRQSYLVRRWGEHVVSHSQQQLAIRCFMCTGAEPSAPWASPGAQQVTSFAEAISRRSPLASPEPQYMNPANLMPPGSQPMAAANNKISVKGPALKLITSFDSQPSNRFRFPGLKSDDRTPTNAPGVTPIAESAVIESALSPGALPFKMSNSRTGTPAFNRRRLPSIGETPVDVHPPSLPANGFNRPVDYTSTSENDDSQDQQSNNQDDHQPGLLSSAKYDPDEGYKPSPQTAVQASSDKFLNIKGLPSPAAGLFEALREQSDSRNGSRVRKPDGLELTLHDVVEADRLNQSDATMASFRSPASMNSFGTKSPSVSGRSIDQYIHSLDEANYHSQKYPGHPQGRARRNTDESASQSSARRVHTKSNSQDTRGRHEKRYIQPAKRSPSSPVPMTPEEVANYQSNSTTNDDDRRTKQSSKARSASRVRKPRSRNSSERRNNRSSSRNTKGRAMQDPSSRGRSIDRPGSRNRSPSSPLPMSMTDDALRLVTSDRERRGVQQRGGSQRPERTTTPRRDPSPDDPRMRARSHSHNGQELYMGGEYYLTEQAIGGNSDPDTRLHETSIMLSEEVRNRHSATAPPTGLLELKRRELAAAELEARRLSLARNPSAPNIPLPGEAQPARMGLESPPFTANSFGPRTPGRRRVSTSKVSPEYPSSSDSNSSRSGGPVGLPATPKAMRHPRYNGYEETAPAVPSVPDGTILLSDARYQPDAETISRSMSVPVPETQHFGMIPTDIPTHPRFNPHLPRSRSNSRNRNMSHRRESSREVSSNFGGSPVSISIEETIENAMQRRAIENPPILPELQHLNTAVPPPPPLHSLSGTASPRESSGTIDIAIDNENMGRLLPRAMTAAPASSMETRPMMERRRTSYDHRRGKSVNESFSSKIRNLARMGSSNRGSELWGSAGEIPYETVPVTEGRI